MKSPDRPVVSDRLVKELEDLYLQAQRQIVQQVRTALLAGNFAEARQRRLQLAAVIATLDQLGAATDDKARKLVEQAWADGVALVDEQLPGAVSRDTFAGVSLAAVVTLQESLLGRLEQARRQVGRTVDDVYAKAQRRASLRALLGADGSVESAKRAMAAELMKDQQVKRLMQDGATAFVDRSGGRWTMSQYTEMAVRTVTREAVVQGQITRMAGHGITLCRVSTHGGACRICVPMEGRLMSIDGLSGSFQGESYEPLIEPPFHPNCRHTLMPVSTRVREFEATLNA